MRLNRGGYITVEIILASVVAVTIAIFLMEITIRLVNITDDAYVDTELLTDKALIIKNIKEELEKDIENYGGIVGIDSNSNNKIYSIEFCNNIRESERNLYTDNNIIGYVNGDYESGQYANIYEKKLNKSLSNIKIETNKTGIINNGDYILFKITADSKFSKENFEANIIVYNNKTCS